MKYEQLKTFMVCCIFLLCSVQAMADIRVLSTTPASSASACDGVIEIEASGTAEPFSIQITTPDGQVIPVPFVVGIYTLENRCPGDYSIVVTNAYMCEVTLDATVCGPLEITAPVRPLINNASICALEDGAIIFENDITPQVSGGTAPYIWEWSNGTTGPDLYNVPAGSYELTITDANGCFSTFSYEVEKSYEDPVITIAEPKLIPPSSCDVHDGEISFAAFQINDIDGGTAPYTLLWETGSTENYIQNLSEGDYMLTITDANGCEDMFTYTLTGETTPEIYLAEIDPPCSGGSNGSIEIGISGSYTNITWSTGDTGDMVSELSEDTYCVTVTNGSCELVECYELVDFEYPPLTMSASTSGTCSDTDPNSSQGNGTIQLSVNGGDEPYTYEWDNGGQEATLANLNEGNYCVIVTDRCGDQITDCYDVGRNLPLEITGTVNTACPDDVYNNFNRRGRIFTNVTGGNPPYSYHWSPSGSTTSYNSNLLAGNHQVTVTDNSGCVATKSFTVEEDKLTIDIVEIKHCEGGDCSEAFVDVSITNNTGGVLEFEWHAFINGTLLTFSEGDLNNIPGIGTYTLTVTTENGCLFIETIEIKNCQDVELPEIEEARILPSSDAIEGGGIILWMTSSGDDNFIFQWEGPNGFTSNDSYVLNEGVGTYTVTISNGCNNSITETFEIEECPLEAEVILPIDNTCSEAGYAILNIKIKLDDDPESPRKYFLLDNNSIRPLDCEGPVMIEGEEGLFDVATLRMRSGNFELEIINQDDCGALVEGYIQPGFGTIETPTFTSFFYNLTTGKFIPSHCGTAISCNDTFIDYLLHDAIEPVYLGSEGNSCQVQLNCRDNPLRTFTGQVVEKSGYKNGYCYEGTYCEVETIMMDPVFAELSPTFPEISGGISPDVPIYFSVPIDVEQGSPVEKEVVLKNLDGLEQCVTIYRCDGTVVEEFATGEPLISTECSTFHPGYAPNKCLTVKRCNDEVVDTQLDSETSPNYCGCPYALTSDENDNMQSLKTQNTNGQIIEAFSRRTQFSNNLSVLKSINLEAYSEKNQENNSNKVISIENSKKLSLTKIHPNPFNQNLNINLHSPIPQNLSFTLYDLLGQPVFREKQAAQEGKNSIKLELPFSLIDGIYFLEVKDEEGHTDGRKVVHSNRSSNSKD